MQVQGGAAVAMDQEKAHLAAGFVAADSVAHVIQEMHPRPKPGLHLLDGSVLHVSKLVSIMSMCENHADVRHVDVTDGLLVHVEI